MSFDKTDTNVLKKLPETNNKGEFIKFNWIIYSEHHI